MSDVSELTEITCTFIHLQKVLSLFIWLVSLLTVLCAPRESPEGWGGGGYSPIKVTEVLVVPFRGSVPF